MVTDPRTPCLPGAPGATLCSCDVEGILRHIRAGPFTHHAGSWGRKIMHLPSLIKYLVFAWGGPVMIVLLVRALTPDPSQSRSDFPSKTFKPSRVWVAEEREARGADFFELRIESPEGAVFFHRDPDRDPIVELDRRFPKDSEVTVLYNPDAEGNALLEIASVGTSSSTPVLSFDSIMNEYASRRRVVYIVAAVWWTFANLLSYALWKVDVSGDGEKQSEPEQAPLGSNDPA